MIIYTFALPKKPYIHKKSLQSKSLKQICTDVCMSVCLYQSSTHSFEAMFTKTLLRTLGQVRMPFTTHVLCIFLRIKRKHQVWAKRQARAHWSPCLGCWMTECALKFYNKQTESHTCSYRQTDKLWTLDQHRCINIWKPECTKKELFSYKSTKFSSYLIIISMIINSLVGLN